METTYEIHPAAELFPMMSDEELQLLADDIREQGLLEPIAIFENKVLDGRNRLKACGLVGVKPKYVQLNGECKSPLLYVAAKNVLRRQLTTAQRAAIAAEMKPLLMEEAKQRQIASQFQEKNNDKPNEIRSASRDADHDGHRSKSSEIAARAMQVGSASVDRAFFVYENRPDLFLKIKSGELTARTAERIARKQVEIKAEKAAKPNPKRDVAHKRRMEEGVSMIAGACSALNTLRIQAVASMLSTAEVQTWITKAQDARHELSMFIGMLKKGGANVSHTKIQNS